MARWISLVFVLAWCWPSAAWAGEDRCAAAWGLRGLAPAEQELLHRSCVSKSRPGVSLLPTLSAVATRATWESAALAGIFEGAGPHVDVGTSAEQVGRLKALRRVLQAGLVERRASAANKGDRSCGWVRAAFDMYVEDLAAGEGPAPPIADYALAGDPCLGLEAEWLSEVYFLTIAADRATGLSVVAGTSERVVVQWFGAQEAVSHGGRQIFVVAVPRLSVVTVEASHPGGLSARWHGFVARDQTVWDEAPGAACLRVSAMVDADTTLLLDGRPLTRGQSLAHQTVGVLGKEHELVALRCARGGKQGCTVSFRESITAGAGVSNLCQEIKVDLQERSTAAVLGAEAAPGCDKGLSYKMGVQAEDYLRASARATGREFRDLKAVASATEALASLKSSLNPVGGAAVGAKTGSDSLEMLGTVAKEAWRQGIDSLLSFELRCEASGYRVVGSRLAVKEVLERQRGDVEGLDLQRMVVVDSMQVRFASQIPAAVASVIDRLFDVAYARLLVGEPRVPHRRAAEVELSIFHKQAAGVEQVADARPSEEGELVAGSTGRVPTIEAIQIAEQGRPVPAICGQLARPERGPELLAAAQEAIQDRAGRRYRGAVELRRSDAGDAADVASYIASIRAGRPGTYLLLVRWTGEKTPADALCLYFEVRRSELWGSVGVAFDATTRAGVKDYQWLHMRAMMGRTFYTKWRPWLGFGLVGGYTMGRFISREGLPSWQDVTVDPSGSDELFTWTRHALMVGPLVELRSRKATLPLELRARLSLVGGLGVVNVHRLPPQFVTFVTPDPLNNPKVRFTANIDALLELGGSYSAGPVTLGHALFFGVVAVNDMLREKHAATALNGGGLVLGLSLIVGGGV